MPKIHSFQRVVPTIYAYNTPGVTYNDGWTKIGYTERRVTDRINEQTHTAGIRWELLWTDNAMYKDGSGEYFTDHAFHDWLESEARTPRRAGTEWFQIDGTTSEQYFNRFARRQGAQPDQERLTYKLRAEQERAVHDTKEYFESGGTEFLWNAKPRFGKTLTSYDLIVSMGLHKVLIVTNRPSIANSWAEDFRKFIGWQHSYCFVSDTDALKGKPGVVSRDEFIKTVDDYEGMIAFESLQGLKGSVYFGGQYDKLKWMSTLDFDLLIIDEAQEGVDTMRTERAFRNISRKYTLYLSGTPFKQLAGDQFASNQIFNWSYADEQEAKESWTGEDANPYGTLPKLAMFTYQLSPMIRERIEKGLDLSGEDGAVDYAFDLNEFFATNEAGRFIHEDEIKKFLHALTTQEKYPFSTPELRDELPHTMWYLNRVKSAKALEKLLREDEVFRDYHVVLAAGDGVTDDSELTDAQSMRAFDRVKDAIELYEKTITLTVGQLTVGITIPEWSGVLMLCNLASPSSYMQAAFRAQNPCILTRNGQRFRKETAYVFDFDPARTLIIFDEFANNLISETAKGGGTSEDRSKNIKRLLNFFPVIGEDSEGKMVELDAASVLSIPRRLKSQEVVRRGFMSNFLFTNISNVFGAPAYVQQILEQLTPAQEEGGKAKPGVLDGMNSVPVDENGNVDIPNEIVIGKTQDLFGDKLYEITGEIAPVIDAVAGAKDTAEVDRQVQNLVDAVKQKVKEDILPPIAGDYGITKKAQERLQKQVDQEVEQAFQQIQEDYKQQERIAKAELERKRQEAETESEVQQAEAQFHTDMEDALKSFVDTARETVQKTIDEKPQELVERVEKAKQEQEKRTVEDEVRAHLRGFARTIPSFIMAYGDENLTLANFDDHTEDDVFLEVTGITEEQFRFLRDGGDYIDPETGRTEHFRGHLFDEVVFNDSVAEFWKKKLELADYFDENQEEDIFDYIPPQKTNQIFTPRWVVSMMVDELEKENPGCFDDPTKTFADLYMKSGLYITEIVKRLFRSERMKELFPDDQERVQHILQHQVYGMAPTRIIYLIATNYILGFDENLREQTHNFVEADAAEAAKNGTLKTLVDQHFS